eukprot:4704957-Pleurochrysis_carterae.AAC.2
MVSKTRFQMNRTDKALRDKDATAHNKAVLTPHPLIASLLAGVIRPTHTLGRTGLPAPSRGPRRGQQTSPAETAKGTYDT